jgi:hypothetical protein
MSDLRPVYQEAVTITAARSFHGTERPTAFEVSGGGSVTYNDGAGNIVTFNTNGVHPCVVPCMNITAVTATVVAQFARGLCAGGIKRLRDASFAAVAGINWLLTNCTLVGGKLRMDGSDSAVTVADLTNLITGHRYKVSWEQEKVQNGSAWTLGAELGGGTVVAAATGDGPREVIVTCGAARKLTLVGQGGTEVYDIDNIRVEVVA